MQKAELPVWRSLLFVPVNVPKFVETSADRGADGIILDLEDSVPWAEKAAARGMVAEAAKKVGRKGGDVLVRINRPLEHAVRDIEAVVSPEIAGLLLPKIDSASHVRLLCEVIDMVEARKEMPRGHTKISVLIETAEAFPRVEEIAASHPRLVAVSLGSEDFAMDTSSEPAPDTLLYPKQRVIIAAHANKIMPMGVIGSVADFSDEAAYRQAVVRSRRFGIVGSACIHPRIVPILNECFSPSAEEVHWANRVKEVFAEATSQGRASVQLDGKMIDYPIVERAEKVIDLDNRIKARLARAPA